MSAERRSRFRNLDDSVGKLRHLHFRGAPREIHPATHTVPPEIFSGDAYDFGSDHLALQVTRLTNGGVFLYREYPAHARQSLLRIHKLSEFLNVRGCFNHPIVAGNPSIQRTG